VQQALVIRRQNDHFRRAMELLDGNFAETQGWQLTRESCGSFSRRNRADGIINKASALTSGSNINLHRVFPSNHSLIFAADYITSYTRFRVWNADESCRCRIKGYGVGIGWQMINGPLRLSSGGILIGNKFHYGKYSNRVENASFGGHSYGVGGAVEYAISHGAWTFSPRAEGNFDGIFHGSYGVDSGDVTVGSCRTEFSRGTCGLRAQLQKDRVEILTDFALSRDFLRRGGAAAAIVAGGEREIMPAHFPNRNFAAAKLQVVFPWRKSWELSLNYNFIGQKHFWEHALALGSTYRPNHKNLAWKMYGGG
jgi:hypothetical protein